MILMEILRWVVIGVWMGVAAFALISMYVKNNGDDWKEIDETDPSNDYMEVTTPNTVDRPTATYDEYRRQISRWEYCWTEAADSCPVKLMDNPPLEHTVIVEQNPVSGEYRKRDAREALENMTEDTDDDGEEELREMIDGLEEGEETDVVYTEDTDG